jgi:hypothetical protein
MVSGSVKRFLSKITKMIKLFLLLQSSSCTPERYFSTLMIEIEKLPA